MFQNINQTTEKHYYGARFGTFISSALLPFKWWHLAQVDVLVSQQWYPDYPLSCQILLQLNQSVMVETYWSKYIINGNLLVDSLLSWFPILRGFLWSLYICFACERCNMSSIIKRSTREVANLKKNSEQFGNFHLISSAEIWLLASGTGRWTCKPTIASSTLSGLLQLYHARDCRNLWVQIYHEWELTLS